MFKTSLNLLKTQLVKTTGEGTPMQLDLSLQTNLKSSDQTLQPMFDNINKLYLEGSIYLDLSNKIELLKLNTKYKEGMSNTKPATNAMTIAMAIVSFVKLS